MVRSSASPRACGTNMMPPGIPGRDEYNPLPDHEPGHDRRRQGQAAARRRPATMGYEIQFLYAQRRPGIGRRQGRHRQGPEDGWLRPAAVRHDRRGQLHGACRSRTRRSTSASAGWCSDWPSGRSWFPPMFQSTNIEEGGPRQPTTPSSPRRPSTTRSPKIQRSPIDEQPGSGTSWTRTIADDLLPAVRHRLRRCRDDAWVEDPRHVQRLDVRRCRPGRTCGSADLTTSQSADRDP